MAPIALLTGRRDARKGKPIQFVGEFHLRRIVAGGALPIIVPAMPDALSGIDRLLDEAAGLLVMEGGDFGPQTRPVPANTAPSLEEIDPVKDALELALMRGALEREMPVLGICRGAELLNLVRGGELYVDLPREVGRQITHLSADDYHGNRHPVDISPGTPLAELYGEGRISATSYHHQGIRTLGRGLREMGHAPDQVIEALWDPDADFAWGLQFHPERQLDEHPGHPAVHLAFCAAMHRYAAR